MKVRQPHALSSLSGTLSSAAFALGYLVITLLSLSGFTTYTTALQSLHRGGLQRRPRARGVHHGAKPRCRLLQAHHGATEVGHRAQ